MIDADDLEEDGFESAFQAPPRPPKKVLKLIDSDTGESSMDVVRVPEGFSIQLGMRNGVPMPEDYISVILNPEQVDELAVFLTGTTKHMR